MNTILRYITYCTIFCFSIGVHAQTIISEQEGAVADPSALLEIDSDSLGVLVPRLSENGRLSIGSPATGLLLFQTDQTPGYRYNQGVPASPDWIAVDIAGTDSTFFDKRIPMDSVKNGQGSFVINEPGSYYFTKDIYMDINSNNDGIEINSSYVTIDMNGFSLRSSRSFIGDGIHIVGSLRNVTVKNGKISDWLRYGILASGADNCTFKNLQIDNCDRDGLTCGENNLILKCEFSNNLDQGLSTQEGNVIVDCVAADNQDNGFFIGTGCILEGCVAYENWDDGFSIGSGCRLEGCTAYNNENHGFDISWGGVLNECNAYRNGGNGFDLFSACILENSKASRNGFCLFDDDCGSQPSSTNALGLSLYGNGIRADQNSIVRNCTSNNNDRVGIRTTGFDNYIVNNSCSGNNNVGFYITDPGSLIVSNYANQNADNPSQDFIDGFDVISGNFVLDSNCSYGPIINVGGVGNINTITNSDHPFANFEY